jgi:WD40 repeat protein
MESLRLAASMEPVMSMGSRIRNSLRFAFRSPWLVFVLSIATGYIAWWCSPPVPRSTIPISDRVCEVDFSPDWQRFLVLTEYNGDNSVELSDTHGKDLSQSLAHADLDNFSAGWFSSDGYLILSDKDAGLWFWNVNTGERRKSDVRDVHCKEAMRFSQDGRLVALVFRDRLEIRDWPTFHKRTTIDCSDDVVVNCRLFDFSPDNDLLAVCCRNEEIQIWNWQKGQKCVTIDIGKECVSPYRCCQCSFSSDNTTLAVVFPHGAVIYYDVHTGTELRRFHPVGVWSQCKLAPDHRTLLTVSEGGEVWLWQLSSGRGAYLQLVRDGATLSADGKMVIASTRQYSPLTVFYNESILGQPTEIPPTCQETTFWDLDSCKSIAVLPLSPATGWTFMSPDGRLCATIDVRDKVMHLWDIPPRKPVGLIFTTAIAAGVLTWLVQWCLLRLRRPRTAA